MSKMLLRLFKIDETSKYSAFKVAVFNAILGITLSLFLVVFVCVVHKYYDEISAERIGRLVWVEVVLNGLFFPYAVLLIFGISKDNYKWVRIWVKVKVVQASYIFLLNIVMQIYITAVLSFLDALVILVYTLIVEVLYMEIIVFINNYQRIKEQGEENKIQIDEEIERVYVISF